MHKPVGSGGTNHSKRREMCMRAAEALVTEATAAASALREEGPDSCSSERPEHLRGRSQPGSSEASSQLCNPHWHRLLPAVAQPLAKRCEDFQDDPASEAGELLRKLLTGDAAGGGSERDMMQFLRGLLEAMEVGASESGFVLLRGYHYLQARDLPISSRTWRPLLLTAMKVSVSEVFPNVAERGKADAKLLSYVSHWWSAAQASRACEAFMARDAFRKQPATQSGLARLYFELRDVGLRILPEDSSNASAVFMSDSIMSPRGTTLQKMASRPSAATEMSSGLDSLRISEESCSFSAERLEDPKFMSL